MVKTCGECGREFKPGSPKALYCADVECKRLRARKRKRASRSGEVATVLSTVRTPPPLVPSVRAGVLDATVRALEDAGVLDTPAGQNAVTLAERLGAESSDTGSSLAALSKQHLAALEVALKNAPRKTTQLDELRARRARRVGA